MAFCSAEDLETLRGKAQLVPGASGIPSLHPQVAQPFLQRHACYLLTWSWAGSNVNCTSHSWRRPRAWECAGVGVGALTALGWVGLWRSSAIPASSLILVASPQCRLLLATAEHRLSHLLPAAPATQDSSHSRAIDQVTPPPPTPGRLAARQLVPRLLQRGLRSFRLLPGGPPHAWPVPAACEAGGPWPCQGDQILSATCCFH